MKIKFIIISNRLPGQDGLDMLIIGDDRMRKLTRWAETIEKKQGRPVNYAIMSENDYVYRKSARDKFLLDFWRLEITDTIDPDGIF